MSRVEEVNRHFNPKTTRVVMLNAVKHLGVMGGFSLSFPTQIPRCARNDNLVI